MSKRTKNFKMTRGKVIGIAVACVLAAVALLSAVGSATSGFQDFDPFKRNEDNVIPLDLIEVDYGSAKGNGFTVTADDKGVITLSGENKTETAQEVTLAKGVTLDLSKDYILTTGLNGANSKAGNFSFKVVWRESAAGDVEFDAKDLKGEEGAPERTGDIILIVQPTFDETDNCKLYVAIYEDGVENTGYYN